MLPPGKQPPSLRRTRFCPPLLVYDMIRRPLPFLLDVGARYDLVYIGWLGAPFYLVNEPAMLRQMLGDTRRFYKGHFFKRLEIVLGKGLVTLDGQRWFDARRRMQQAFLRGLLPEQQQIVIRHTRGLIERLHATAGDGVIDFDPLMSDLMLRIALDLFFGAGPDVINLDETRHAVEVCNAYARYRMWSLVPERWNTPRKRRFLHALHSLEDTVDRVIALRRGESQVSRAGRCDVLTLLLEAGFEGVELRDHVMTMLIAGHETTATTTALLFGLLARHPRVQDRMYEEVRGLPAGTVPLQSVPLTEAVWKETLRLYPTVPMLDRMAVEDVTLGEYALPAGANILWSPYSLHRKFCRHPDAFHPGRFLEDPKQGGGVYVPFGEGPRMCVGKFLADMEGVTIAALLAREFRFVPADARELEVFPLITLRPRGGVRLRLAPHQLPPSTRAIERIPVGAVL